MTLPNGGEMRGKTPVHLWVVGVLAMLWNAMGGYDYLATQLKLDFYMSQFTEQQLVYFYGLPAWAVAAWAFGVWGSVVGSIGLLMRRSWSMWAFVVSLAGLAVSSIYSFGIANGAEIMGTGGVIFSLVIWVVAILLVIYTWAQTKTGVLR